MVVLGQGAEFAGAQEEGGFQVLACDVGFGRIGKEGLDEEHRKRPGEG